METIEAVHSGLYSKVEGTVVADTCRYAVSPERINDEWVVVLEIGAEYRDKASSKSCLRAPWLNDAGTPYEVGSAVVEW